MGKAPVDQASTASLALRGKQGIITRTSSRNLLWSWSQMIAHHTITGCNLNASDLLGSGNISSTDQGARGSMLKQTKGGKTPIRMGGEKQTFLEDGETIIIRGWSSSDKGNIVGFGEYRGQIIAASSREESYRISSRYALTFYSQISYKNCGNFKLEQLMA